MPTEPTPAAPASAPSPRTPGARIVELLGLLWILLLILPAATSTSSTAAWDIDPWMLFGLSCWLIVAARLVLPARWFFPLTLPVALLGAACMGADFLRHADLLDLGMQWRTFKAQEVRSALGPYALATAIALAVLVAWCVACARVREPRRGGRGVAAAVVAVTAVLAIALPRVAWVRAWPLNGALVAVSALSQSDRLLATLQPALSSVDPRDPHATWHGRATSTAARQTLVFIVGESVRADFLRECDGPAKVRPVAADAVVACDVTSGSDATHTSVPLLISRDMPGQPYRVSTDASFLRAFEEAGFETHWIGDQGRSLAWSDAQWQSYPEYVSTDEAALGPPLAQALARPAPRKAIVLHAYNAHDTYCDRFDHAKAPYAVDCARLGITGPSDAAALRLAYADAIDASVGYIDGVIETLRREPGEAFLLFTPDHGENLYDDARQLYEHALRTPTRWDTHVPAIFWANAAWRDAHPQQWANLRAQARQPLMHADMVPTFLAAGGVRYDDARPLAIDLLDARVPQRRRTIERGLGRVVDWDTLVREAR